MSAPEQEEVMTVQAARALENGEVCLVGVGAPNAAANLARRLHAPDCVLVYESGAIGAKPVHLPLSIGDDDLAATADELVSVPEMFSYWIGGGRIDVGFLGAAQIDRRGNINTTVIGPLRPPDGAPARCRGRAGDSGGREEGDRHAPSLSPSIRGTPRLRHLARPSR